MLRTRRMEREPRIKKIRKQLDLPKKIIVLEKIGPHPLVFQIPISEEDIKAPLIGIHFKIMEVSHDLIFPEIRVLEILIVIIRINA
jgi:hypothetical protein